MKYVWELADIPCGRRVVATDGTEGIICYTYMPNQMFGVCLLNDGLVTHFYGTKAGLADALSVNSYRPKEIT